MSIGNNIAFLRKKKKWTQEQLAERLNVTRQTVSRWEADEVTPELDRLVLLCELFSCKLDSLVRNDLTDQKKIYSEVRIKRVEAFRFASYVMISMDPETDALEHMAQWAEKAGLKEYGSEVRLIGWDFPFISSEQQNRFGLHGYVAACVLPEGFQTEQPGAVIAENKAADYAVITIREPHIRPFERIPGAYSRILEYLKANTFKNKGAENIIASFEYEYRKNGIVYMDVYVSVNDVMKSDGFSGIR